MKFQEILNEKFSTGAHVWGEYVEIYEEPTSSDIKDILKSQDEAEHRKERKIIRFGVDKNNTLFAWNGYILHYMIEKDLKKSFLLKLDYDYKDSKFWLSSEQKTADIDKVDLNILKEKLNTALPEQSEKIDKFLKGEL